MMKLKNMLKSQTNKFYFGLILLVSILPLVSLLLRGVVWGADSFAFMSVTCGQNQYASMLGHSFFVPVLSFFDCNFLLIVFTMWAFYFFALLGLWFFGEKVFENKGWLLPTLVGTITPLFFVEALRLENDFFGWTLSFMVLGLFSLYLDSENIGNKALLLLLSIVIAINSILMWYPSIIIVSICLLLPDYYPRLQKIGWITLILLYSILNYHFFLSSITLGPIVAEELPLIGIIFILHIIHFYKYIPKKYFIPTIALICLGLIKLKYLYLATPFLILGMITQIKNNKIIIFKKEVPIIFIILLLGFGWVIMSVNLYPTQNDLIELKEVIRLSKDNNILLVNDFGSGWLITYLGYETNYKIYFPNPDYNSLERPFYAYTKTKLDCTKINKQTYFCESLIS